MSLKQLIEKSVAQQRQVISEINTLVKDIERCEKIIADLKSKGVKIIKQPQKVFWGGYSSYFADPDDYRWEVAYNPFFAFDENGSLKLE